ncbi:hypothetical protein [Helicobacter sp.]|uniref:hypothetical protein n=1 Tax=Helicobacter sp. TaxID=218 RepID=UPI0025C4863A|nr:hypothetical protein [Helicobacter sp.]MCI5968440.1 hypothetical protein [Helicobacter sp.]MDY2585225.1 hypothetical protein [Helicobacter sp.]
MEFLRDDGLVFCNFFDISEIPSQEGNPEESNKHNVYLDDTKENERVMILYVTDKMQKTSV